MTKPRNDRNRAVSKFCLALEEHRRTDAGRVRTAKEFVAQFFPHDDKTANDLVFVHIPREVRGPILSAWGIRGAKAAVRDDDEQVRQVVHDAMVAGDVDDASFEDGISSQILVDWISLNDWWSFWRHGKLSGVAIQKALATARELGLIDDKWFLANLQGRGGKLKGTDAICDTLSKDQIVGWIRKLHEAGDGSPAGIVAAIGWEVVLARTAQDALLFALDAFAKHVGLVTADAVAAVPPTAAAAKPEVQTAATAPATVPPTPAAPTRGIVATAGAKAGAFGSETTTAKHDTSKIDKVDAHPTMNAPPDAAAAAEAEALNEKVASARQDAPAVATEAGEDAEPKPEDRPSIPTVNGVKVWGANGEEESPALASARAAMMATLMQGSGEGENQPSENWGDSIAPSQPGGAEWSDPPPPTPIASVDVSTGEPSAEGLGDDFISIEEDDGSGDDGPSVPPPLPPRGNGPRAS